MCTTVPILKKYWYPRLHKFKRHQVDKLCCGTSEDSDQSRTQDNEVHRNFKQLVWFLFPIYLINGLLQKYQVKKRDPHTLLPP